MFDKIFSDIVIDLFIKEKDHTRESVAQWDMITKRNGGSPCYIKQIAHGR
jgi:hypothetical protein